MPYVERELLLKDGPPWGFRLQDTPAQGLVISRIRRRSPAANGGVHEGDVVLAINKSSTNGMSHHRAVQLLESTFYILTIKVGRHEAFAERPPPEVKPIRPAPMPMASSVNLNFNRPMPPPPPPPPPEPEPEPEPEPFIPEPAPFPIPAPIPIPIEKLTRTYEPPKISPKNKKSFADSAFYDDPDKYFPSVQEQKQMAKKVADSLTALLNKGSRGAKMFERRRHKWAMSEQQEPDEISLPMAPVAAVVAPPPAPRPLGMPVPPAPPPPLLGNLPVAPPPPNLALLAGLKKTRTTQEVFEEAKQLPKTRHDAVKPQQCFEIAAALKESNSRGSQLFAKRRAKSKKWELEGPEPKPEPQLDVRVAQAPWSAGLKHKPALGKTFVSNPPSSGVAAAANNNNNNGAFGMFPRAANPNSSPASPFREQQMSGVSGRASTTSSTSSHSLMDASQSPSWRPVGSWRPPSSTPQESPVPFDSGASQRSGDTETGFYSSLPRPGSAAGKQEWRSVQFKLPANNNVVST